MSNQGTAYQCPSRIPGRSLLCKRWAALGQGLGHPLCQGSPAPTSSHECVSLFCTSGSTWHVGKCLSESTSVPFPNKQSPVYPTACAEGSNLSSHIYMQLYTLYYTYILHVFLSEMILLKHVMPLRQTFPHFPFI